MGFFRSKLAKPDPLAAGRTPSARSGVRASGGEETQAQRGQVHLGTGDGGAAVAVPLERLAQHVCVTGAPGMRKTSFVSSIVGQAMDNGLAAIVFEPAKVEYASLLSGRCRAFGDPEAAGVLPLKVNPFQVDCGVRVNTWVEDITAAVADSYGASQDASGPLYLEGLVRRLYRVVGVSSWDASPGLGRWPTVKTYLEQAVPFVQEETCSGREVASNVRGFLVRRGRSMAACPALLCEEGMTVSGLVSKGSASVVQLADFGRGSGAFIGMVLLLRLIEHARTLGSRPLHTVVVLEEAHSLFTDALTGEATMFSRLYESALAELRSSGYGFVTVEQRPSLLPEGVFGNSVTRVAFASTHGRDRDAVEKSLGLDEEQTRQFGSLPAGRALMATAGMEGAIALKAQGR